MSAQSPERGGGWVVGRVAGIPVVGSVGWLVAAVALTVLLLPFAARVAPGSAAVVTWGLAAAAVALLFVSTFLHELAHALVARRFAMPVHRIALTLLGGHTELDRAPTARASALVAAAGPVTNLALGAVAWLGWLALPGQGPVAALVLAMAVTNGFVAALNLLPGLPLDGGRVLEAALWGLTGRRATGTRVAAWVGRAVAVGLGAWTLWPALTGRPDLTQVVWGGLIAAFIWSGASQALRSAGIEEAVDRLDLDLLARPAVALPVHGTVAALDAADPAGAIVLVDPAGAPVAVVDLAAADRVPTALRPGTPLGAVATPLPPEALVQAGLRGPAAIDAVRRATARSPVAAVLGPAGQVRGLVHATDVVRALAPRR